MKFSLRVLFIALVISSSARATFALDYIDMGVKDDAAFYQPSVPFEVLTNDEAEESLGPGIDLGEFGFFGSELLLDTGASSILVMNSAVDSLVTNGYQTEGKVFEQGVSGFSIVDVSAPYKVRVSGTDGETVMLSDARILSGQFPDLLTVNGIVGMPAMVGRTVSMEITPGDPGGEIFDLLPSVDVKFGSSIPTSSGHRYTIPLKAKSFNLTEEDTLNGDDPLPIQAPLPMLRPSIGFQGKHATGNFVLDTGAAVSFIDTEIAASLGLDSNGDGIFNNLDNQSFGTLPIGGIGGTVEAPVFLLDNLGLPTNEGAHLNWSAPLVLVLDIHPDIDGVIGSDLLTSGWIDLFSEDPEDTGPIDKVHFDFTELFEEGDTGSLIFDIKSEYDVVQSTSPIGDFDSDGQVVTDDLAAWMAGFGTEIGAMQSDGDGNLNGAVDGDDFLSWARNFGSGMPGDFNSDSAVDSEDLSMFATRFGSIQDGSHFLTWARNFEGQPPVAAAATIPEPSSMLITLGAACCAWSARRRNS